MSEEKKPFTVSDRRHFTREGEVRTEAPAEPPPAPEAPARKRGTPPLAEPPDPAATGGEEAAPLDFLGLLLSLGAQASMMLGGSTQGGGPDLSGARGIISLLEVLKDKTEGRRTEEEEEVLASLLYELRMAYVAASRKAGR